MIRQTQRLSACTHGPHGSSQARTDGSGAGHRVVIVGGGFAGLAAARALRRAPVEVTVVDVGDIRMAEQDGLQFGRGNLESLVLDELLEPVDHVQVTVGIDVAEVTGQPRTHPHRRRHLGTRVTGTSPARDSRDPEPLSVPAIHARSHQDLQ